MTVPAAPARYQFSGNGVTTSFAFPQVFLNAGDITVDLRDASGNPAVGVLNGSSPFDFTISGTQDPATGEYLSGAAIVFNTAPPGGYTVTLFRDPAPAQTLALASNGPLNPPAIGAELDQLDMLAQALLDRAGRTLMAPLWESVGSAPDMTLPLAAARANQVLGFDINGKPMVGGNLGALISLLATGTLPETLPVSVTTIAWASGDQTSAMQAKIDAAYAAGQLVYIGPGVYSVTGLSVYDGQRIIFQPGASLKMTAAGAAIKTLPSPGASAAATHNVKIIDPVIDMNGQNGVAIMLECAALCEVDNAVISGMVTGNFSWDDPFASAQTWPNTGIIIKGVSGVNFAGLNRVRNPQTSGPGAVAASSPVGIWLGTSMGGGNSKKANSNVIEGGQFLNGGIGGVMSVGDDNLFQLPNGSSNGVAFQIGDMTNTTPVKRNVFVKPYMENYITTAIHNTQYATDNWIKGLSSHSPVSGPPPFFINDLATNALLITEITGDDEVAFPLPTLNADPAGNRMIATAGGGYDIQQFVGGGSAGYTCTAFRGTMSAPTNVQNGTLLGQWRGAGYDGTAIGEAGGLYVSANEDFSGTAHGSKIVIKYVHTTTTALLNGLSIDDRGAILHDGLGVWGKTPPSSQPTITGSRGGATAAVLAALLTAIHNTGIIVDGTTA